MTASTEKISSTFLQFSPLDLPISYRFAPRENELIRILHLRQQNVFSNHLIHHVNVYNSNPQHLSERFEKSNDNDEWFFMTERIKVCKGGKNQKRGNNEGYWLAKQPAKKIDAGNGLIGYMRQLVYIAGKKPNCIKIDWRMNEFYFKSENNDKVDYALCKIFVTPRETKNNKSKEDDNGAEENEENVATVNHDGEYQAHDQIMPQFDYMMMMMPVGEQQQQQVTWIPPLFAQDTQGQDSGGQAIVHFEPNPPYVFVEDTEYQQPQFDHMMMMMMPVGEQQQQKVTWSPPLFAQDTQGQDSGGQAVVHFEPNPPDVFVQEGEQQQEQQQVTHSPLFPFQDPHGQDPELRIDNNLIGPDDEDFWRWCLNDSIKFTFHKSILKV